MADVPRYAPFIVSIHALLAECDLRTGAYGDTTPVSIHALLAECDLYSRNLFSVKHSFNPRTPCGVRLPGSIHHAGDGEVSIHALLAECDRFPAAGADCRQCFNPRTPCGVRQPRNPWKQGNRGFNPRTPCGVRRVNGYDQIDNHLFQSTHSLRSATYHLNSLANLHKCFNPRTPCGVRLRPTLYIATQQSKSYFAPTSLKRPSLHGCSF